MRFEALEMRLAVAGDGSSQPAREQPNPNGHAALSDPRQGLAVGSPAPAVDLPSIDGPTVTLDSLRADHRPVLLLFVDPNCGPCNALVPDIARWQRDHADEITIAVISRGATDANRSKFGDRGVANLLLQQDYEVADAFRAHATPAAVLVRADGTIGSPVALGPEQIRTLVWSSVLTPLPFLAQGAARTAGLAVGQTSPALSFAGLDGNSVSLSDFRGDRTMLLFWNNGCGFCQSMLPDLKRWDAAPPAGAPRLVVVSQGPAEENLALGLQSTVVIDDTFAAGRAFGATGTPSAVLLAPDGTVASNVAVGIEAVLQLAGARVPTSHSASG
jgi:thiol-disulfide isomerase/thioredoxin